MSAAQTDSSRQVPAGDAPLASARAAVVIETSERASLYSMYEAREITPEGAFLQGWLLLEIGETVTLELAWTEDERGRVSARVVALEHEGTPGMLVAFSHVDDRVRSLIQTRATTQP